MRTEGQVPRFALIGGIAALTLLLASTLLVIWKFPFRRDAMVQRVEAATGARVELTAYRERWFPPGFTAERVRLADEKGNVLTIKAVALQGSYIGLLQSPTVIGSVHATGLRLDIPSTKTPPVLKTKGSGAGLLVKEIRLEDAVLDFPPLDFLIHSLVLNNVGKGRAMGFHVSLHNQARAGEIRSHGQFGPIEPGRPERTPVSGAFTFQRADLSLDHGIAAATLNASGTFRGPLRRIEVTGTGDLPIFQVVGSSHSVHIASAFDVSVDARTGDVALHRVQAHFNGTTVAAFGNVIDKRITVDTAVQNGRVEDLLLLFTRREFPAMQGPITLQAKFTIPPGPPGFLTRLKVKGEFAITRCHFTNPKAQTPINRLSASGRGEPKQEQREYPTLTVADVRGSVITQQEGVATLPSIVFEAPGLRGQLAGTLGLRDKRINMNGTFQTGGKIEDTTSGFKVLILKALGPFWPRKDSVQTIPFRVTGSAGHPVFKIKLH